MFLINLPVYFVLRGLHLLRHFRRTFWRFPCFKPFQQASLCEKHMLFAVCVLVDLRLVEHIGHSFRVAKFNRHAGAASVIANDLSENGHRSSLRCRLPCKLPLGTNCLADTSAYSCLSAS